MRLAHGLITLALAAAATLPGAVLVHGTEQDDSHRQYDHIFVIVEENIEFKDLIGNPKAPTFNMLANTYGLATQYFGTIHPSEGNYVSLVGGSAYGITDDASYKVHTINKPSIVDQLEAAGLTWKGYFQNLPFAGYADTCYPTTGPCLYASKHNGFVNFAHVQNSPSEMAKLVPDTDLGDDLASNDVPNFVFIAPDQCHDLHGIGGTCTGDQLFKETDSYLKTTVHEIMRSPVWERGRNAIVVTTDEGSTSLGCCDANPGGGHIATVVIRNHQERPLQDATPYNHHSLVATIQAAFGLGCTFNGAPVGDTCDTAHGVKPLALLFNLRAGDSHTDE